MEDAAERRQRLQLLRKRAEQPGNCSSSQTQALANPLVDEVSNQYREPFPRPEFTFYRFVKSQSLCVWLRTGA
uniref:Uncharacterized protein n=1 Tax=Tetraselmis sp. GSL018 TaxID=582737 RepID=A0A061SAG2_9CHLO